jgi:hypothetical protein
MCDIRHFDVTVPKMCGNYIEADFDVGGSMAKYTGMAVFGNDCDYVNGDQDCTDDSGINHPGSFEEEIINGQIVDGYCCNASINCPVRCQGDWSNWSPCDVSCAVGSRRRTYIVDVPAAEGGIACPHNNSAIEVQECCANPNNDTYFCGQLEVASSTNLMVFDDISQFQCGCETAFLQVFPSGGDGYRGTPTCDSIFPPPSDEELELLQKNA